MNQQNSFKWRHFEAEIILLHVRLINCQMNCQYSYFVDIGIYSGKVRR